ncbi:unnamed protein product [Prunus armeniaca]|uniref:Uncharacterized protein n=1 Tax=Prunus armeniaca TaxID=36596 RepID=A0A6J5UBJ1_PRUAR|nr:hypothetical protein GBA52_008441 [Prunus armeniaca]CAB4273671.1 unnamed protein product [Prunus armeniaca]CAB4304191.1 unnamed protein product [Prunus armeniaca]
MGGGRRKSQEGEEIAWGGGRKKSQGDGFWVRRVGGWLWGNAFSDSLRSAMGGGRRKSQEGEEIAWGRGRRKSQGDGFCGFWVRRGWVLGS